MPVADVASLTVEGAYDGEAVYDAVGDNHPEVAYHSNRERLRF